MPSPTSTLKDILNDVALASGLTYATLSSVDKERWTSFANTVMDWIWRPPNRLFAWKWSVTTKTITITGDTPVSVVQSIGTSDETLALGEIATLGWLIAKNLDATNYLQLGHTSGTYSIKLKAGEFCSFRVGSGMTAIHALANTGACLLQYLLLPD